MAQASLRPFCGCKLHTRCRAAQWAKNCSLAQKTSFDYCRQRPLQQRRRHGGRCTPLAATRGRPRKQKSNSEGTSSVQSEKRIGSMRPGLGFASCASNRTLLLVSSP